MASVLIERDGSILRITLNRPDVRNAIDEEVIGALSSAAATAADDHSLRAIVLAGNGKAFCAGADVGWMAKAIAYSRQENLSDAEDLARLMERLDTLPVPVIGRIQGSALGGGVGLAAICDIVIAADDAVFGLRRSSSASCPPSSPLMCLRKIGISAARELFLTGVRFDAARAKGIGLVHEVVPADVLDAAVCETNRRGARRESGGDRSGEGADPRDRRCAARPRDWRDDQRHCRPARFGRRPGRTSGVSREAQAELDAMTFRRVLIANRGEIAIRIARACREAGLESIAVYSDADRNAPHVRAADRAVHIGRAQASDSYLSIDAIIEAARSTSARSHPSGLWVSLGERRVRRSVRGGRADRSSAPRRR